MTNTSISVPRPRDEFALLLPAVDTAAALDGIAGRLRISFEKPFAAAPKIKLTATIGTAMSGPDTDPASLLGTADTAMYAAKRASKRGQGPGYRPAGVRPEREAWGGTAVRRRPRGLS